MMMLENDPQTQALISYRQHSLLAEAERNRLNQASPSPLRVAIGLMLIRLGERLRGCNQATPETTTRTMPKTRLHPAHQA